MRNTSKKSDTTRCICNPKSVYVNKNCKAKVHRDNVERTDITEQDAEQQAAGLKIAAATERIVREIMRYESNTFSSSSCKITRVEAYRMTAQLICMRVAIGDNVDGITLSSLLEELR